MPSPNTSSAKSVQAADGDAQLKLFVIRAAQVFDHCLAGTMAIIDAADLLHDAATASGLVARYGEDGIQKVMAAAFASASAERDKGGVQ